MAALSVSTALATTIGNLYGFHWSFSDDFSRLNYVLLSNGESPEVGRSTSLVHHRDKWATASHHCPLVVKIVPEDR